jgi:hypothetical protein
VTDAIRYAILDHASDEAYLWELPWSLSTGGVEIHPRRTVEEVRAHLADLLREGHVEMVCDGDPQATQLSLDEALAAAADDANWDPASARAVYLVTTTPSGDTEYVAARATT